MAENKKSFILHLDSLSILEEMTFEQKGILFDAIYKHQLGEEIILDFAMKMAFAPFKNQFNRDDEKYNEFKEKQSDNGKKGGRPPKTKPLEENPNNPSLFDKSQKSLNVSDSVSINESASKNVKVNNIEERKSEFAFTLKPFYELYGYDMCNSFYKYWSEPNKSNTKFRMELEKTWEINLRLTTWAKNDKNFSYGKTTGHNTKQGNSLESAEQKADAILARHFDKDGS